MKESCYAVENITGRKLQRWLGFGELEKDACHGVNPRKKTETRQEKNPQRGGNR